MAQLCTLMGIRNSPRTTYSPWTNGRLSTKPKFGTHLRMFPHNTRKDAIHNIFQNSMFLLVLTFLSTEWNFNPVRLVSLQKSSLQKIRSRRLLKPSKTQISQKKVFLSAPQSVTLLYNSKG